MGVTRSMTAAATAFVLTGMGAFGNPETLVLRNLKGDKTVEIQINYDQYPKTDPPAGYQWSDFDKDTLWYDSANWDGTGLVAHVQYDHLFRARLNGHEGLGYDYLDYEAPGRGNQHYHGMFGFEFDEDTLYQSILEDGAQLRENPKLPVPNDLVYPGSSHQFDITTFRMPNWVWAGIDTYLWIDRYPNWGNDPVDPVSGTEIPHDRNGKAGAPPAWLVPRMLRH